MPVRARRFRVRLRLAGGGIVVAASIGHGHWMATTIVLLAGSLLTMAVTAQVQRLRRSFAPLLGACPNSNGRWDRSRSPR